MKISKRAEYGLMAMIFLAKNPIRKVGRGIFSLREISAETKTSFVFLEKIFSKLEKAGLVKGIKGMRGGYVLARPAQKISANDVVYALESATAADCGACGKSEGCLTKNVWKKIDGSISKTLQSITLKSLVK